MRSRFSGKNSPGHETKQKKPQCKIPPVLTTSSIFADRNGKILARLLAVRGGRLDRRVDIRRGSASKYCHPAYPGVIGKAHFGSLRAFDERKSVETKTGSDQARQDECRPTLSTGLSVGIG